VRRSQRGYSARREKALEPGAIEADYDFTVYHGDGRRHVTELFEFRQRSLIRCDITFGIFDLVLRKKLFHFSAKHSAGLAVHDHSSIHENLGSLENVQRTDRRIKLERH
jgi:hypothetical protein